jgi:hypothetical protein
MKETLRSEDFFQAAFPGKYSYANALNQKICDDASNALHSRNFIPYCHVSIVSAPIDDSNRGYKGVPNEAATDPH